MKRLFQSKTINRHFLLTISKSFQKQNRKSKASAVATTTSKNEVFYPCLRRHCCLLTVFSGMLRTSTESCENGPPMQATIVHIITRAQLAFLTQTLFFNFPFLPSFFPLVFWTFFVYNVIRPDWTLVFLLTLAVL